MKTTCPRCACTYDIKDAIIVRANAAIVARRRRANGTKLTSAQAKAMNAKSAEARRKGKAQRASKRIAQMAQSFVCNGSIAKVNKNQGQEPATKGE